MAYPREPYCIGYGTGVLHTSRAYDKTINVTPDLPGNIIVIHGVNDVGSSYEAVEKGLCQGLDARLLKLAPGKPGLYRPGTYRMPGNADKDKLEADPDAVFFKRKIDQSTHSPVIPFYWGFREVKRQAGTVNGQHTDRYGNRLDKDLSKGGGPSGNATSTLPDMWNRGLFSPVDMGGDPLRPLCSAAGRMYMVLAAKRLAALISMIRDFDLDEVVTIVGHSQGCLIALLAQAFLLEDGLRPADTLILTHPPYSLVNDTTVLFKTTETLNVFGGGTDAAMKGQYDAIGKRQTCEARLQTLANIVHGIVAKKHATPPLAELTDHAIYHGMVGTKWVASADRDNRGKVYLYFCPEDMTVTLDNIKGIGWQGVPDFMGGSAISKTENAMQHAVWGDAPPVWKTEYQQFKPLSSLGAGFFQRVFTNKKRVLSHINRVPSYEKQVPAKEAPSVELVGGPPHDFVLHGQGEDDHAHVAQSQRSHRADLDQARWPPSDSWYRFLQTEAGKRRGLRAINGEALPVSVPADLRGSGQIDAKDIPHNSSQSKLPANEQGPCEAVDPIDAPNALVSKHGINKLPTMLIDDPRAVSDRTEVVKGELGFSAVQRVLAAINRGKDPDDQCLRIHWVTNAHGNQLNVARDETPNEARLRWQHEVSPKSFHSAIIGSSENHRQVTAYDVAIGGGQASSDPNFYGYLCAVADWRLQKGKTIRPSILSWDNFVTKFDRYLKVEPEWRRDLIQGNADYYSNGELPACVPSLLQGLPSTVVCETIAGTSTVAAQQPDSRHIPAACSAAPQVKKEGK